MKGGKKHREPLRRDIIEGVEGARSCPDVSGGGAISLESAYGGARYGHENVIAYIARLVAFNFAFDFAVAVLLTRSIGCPLRARREYQCHQPLR
jgi:hypothetical protein